MKKDESQIENALPAFQGKIVRGQKGEISNRKISIVVSTYHQAITSRLLAGAVESLRAAGIADSHITVLWVPGAWGNSAGCEADATDN